MESIRFIGISICITTVITSIFTMLLPNGKLDNVIKFAITLFFLTSILSPFLNTDLQLDIKTFTNEIITPTNKSMEVEITQAFIDIAKLHIEEDINSILHSNNINPKKIEIGINILDDTSIYIEKVKIFIDFIDDDTTYKIYDVITTEIGISPEIIATN